MKYVLTLKDLLPRLESEITRPLADALKSLMPDPANVQVRRVEGIIQTAEPVADAKTGSVTMFASTRDMDRDREILMPKGCDLTQYRLSPVILEGHNYAKPPIGKAAKITRDEYGVKMQIEWAPTEDGEKYAALASFMRLQASVGFIPLDRIDKQHDEWEKTVGELAATWPELRKNRKELEGIVRKWMLLETSIVPVPCNPHAIQDEIAKAVEAGTIKSDQVALVLKAVGMPEDKGVTNRYSDEGGDLSIYAETDPWPGMKPFPNEHAARLTDPDQYNDFRRKNDAFGAGIHAVYGIKRGPPRVSELQAIRFDADKFSAAEARAWLKDHDHKPIAFEAATGKGGEQPKPAPAAVKLPCVTPYRPTIIRIESALDAATIRQIVSRTIRDVIEVDLLGKV